VRLLSDAIVGGPPTAMIARCRELVEDRKVIRFLDEVSAPPFIAAVESFRIAAAVSATETALFTISSWEAPPMLPPPFDVTAEIDVHRKLAEHYASANPRDALRCLPVNPLCQIAIALGIQGPNAHFVGDGDALMHALVLAETDLAVGAARAAIVVAFEAEGPDGPPQAMAVVVAASTNGVPPPTVRVVDPAAAAALSSVQALRMVADAARRVGAARTEVRHRERLIFSLEP